MAQRGKNFSRQGKNPISISSQVAEFSGSEWTKVSKKEKFKNKQAGCFGIQRDTGRKLLQDFNRTGGTEKCSRRRMHEGLRWRVIVCRPIRGVSHHAAKASDRGKRPQIFDGVRQGEQKRNWLPLKNAKSWRGGKCCHSSYRSARGVERANVSVIAGGGDHQGERERNLTQELRPLWVEERLERVYAGRNQSQVATICQGVSKICDMQNSDSDPMQKGSVLRGISNKWKDVLEKDLYDIGDRMQDHSNLSPFCQSLNPTKSQGESKGSRSSDGEAGVDSSKEGEIQTASQPSEKKRSEAIRIGKEFSFSAGFSRNRKVES
eukprot:Gb_07411 [translate_table: standard]